jgi:hypothetical protein
MDDTTKDMLHIALLFSIVAYPMARVIGFATDMVRLL